MLFYGLEEQLGFILLLGVISILFYKRLILDKFKNFQLPPYSFYYLLFLVFFVINISWSKNPDVSLTYLSLFLSGFLFWVVAYNSKDNLKQFDLLIILLGILYGGLVLLNLSTGESGPTEELSLIKYAVPARHHHHIGDLWAPVLIISSILFVKSEKKFLLSILPLGFYFLFLSLSRSAYVALISGSVYILKKMKMKREYRYIFWFFIALSLILFLYAGAQKNTLGAHAGYLLQAITGSLANPLGIGVGNIDSGLSSPHNIILEVIVGMGILGISFIVWLFLILKNFILSKDEKGVLYKACFITITVNFLTDYTYLIPTVLWVWFISLGLAQANSKTLGR